MRFLLGLVVATTLLLGSASTAAAQDYRGKVAGTVSDVNTAAVPGARVVLRNDDTGIEVVRQTDSEGRYQFDFVDPGTYTVTVELAGFKRAEQKNVLVRQRGDVTSDVTLEVGGVADVVTVEAPPVQVEFTTSSSALTIDNKIIDQLPIRGRNPYNVSTLDPTVSPGTGTTANENRPYHHAFANDVDAGGGTRSGNDVLLDGVPLTSSFKTSYTPNLDAVQEVTFQKNAVDSEYGYSSGGIVVLNMKSGTNEFHGTGFVHGRSPRFNAFGDPTLVRTNGANETAFRGTNLKIYGGSFGGPIMKNRLFFFTTYEKWKDAQPLSLILTVPTAKMRQGDFSELGTRTIHNPFQSQGTNGVRPAFAGNIIPQSLWDPTAVRALALLPSPNLPGLTNNLQVSKMNNTEYWNFSSRVDYNHSEKWKTFMRYGHFKANLLESNPTDAPLLPINGSNRYGLSVAADTVYTLSPKMVINLRGNFQQMTDEYAGGTAVAGEEGIAGLWPGNAWYTGLFTGPNVYYPAFDVPTGTTNNRLGRPGREFWQHPQGWGLSARLNYYAGDHSTKYGVQFRQDKGKGARFEPLNFWFRQNLTANQATNPNLVNTGNEWATFLLGAMEPNPNLGNTNNNFARRVPVQEVVSKGYSAYFQDDWKVTSRLNLNLGLRWEYEPGPVDPANRLSRMIDLTSPIPEFQAVRPAIPATVTTLLAGRNITQQFNGAWQFADENKRGAWEREKFNLLPRIGLAFRVDDKSALRFGYSRYLAPSQRIRDPLGDFVEQYTGFTTTSFVLPLVGGVPQQTLSNPFPAGRNPVQPEVGQSLGRYTNLGNSFTLDALEQKPPVNDRFSLSYQREVWGRIVLDFDYFLNAGHNLPATIDLNMVDPEFSYTVARSELNRLVANPFFNILTPQQFPGTLRNQPNVTVASLLRPFPQYGAINQANTPIRKERLHSFSIQAQRPYSKGVSFIVAYAYNREKTTEFFDDLATYARQLDWFDSENPRHRFTNAITWDIPIGRDRWLLSDAPQALDAVIGGWQFTTTTRAYSGRLLIFGQNLRLVGDPHVSDNTTGPLGMWFNAAAFSALPTSNNTADPPNLVRRANPRSFEGVLGPSAWQTDMTISKSFRITERFRLETRLEAYNAFNHLNWENPGVDFNNAATFGKVTRRHIAYNGREIQYGLRLVF
jgi:hypothetical protein